MNNIPELTQVKKVMIANTLISDGLEQKEAWEIVKLLEDDLQIMDDYAVNFYLNILNNIYNTEPPKNDEGELISILLKFEKTQNYMESKKKEQKAIDEIIKILETPVKNELSAKLIMRKIEPFLKN